MSNHTDLMDALDQFSKTLYTRTRDTGRAGGGNRPWTKAIASDAMAVHPKQRKQAMEAAAAAGVPTDFTEDGRPLLRDRNHRKRYMQFRGMFDRAGGYGDAQKGSHKSDRQPEPEADFGGF